jgi:hypothetical protein
MQAGLSICRHTLRHRVLLCDVIRRVLMTGKILIGMVNFIPHVFIYSVLASHVQRLLRFVFVSFEIQVVQGRLMIFGGFPRIRLLSHPIFLLVPLKLILCLRRITLLTHCPVFFWILNDSADIIAIFFQWVSIVMPHLRLDWVASGTKAC